MNKSASEEIYTVECPNDLDYVPPMRHFVADLAKLEGFPKKFCFRTEILVDELVTNAVLHGCEDPQAEIQLRVSFFNDRMDLSVQDAGGRPEKLEVLRTAVYSPRPPHQDETKGRGLVIVQMLSDELNLNLTDNGHTQVRVTKMREEDDTSSAGQVLYEGNP